MNDAGRKSAHETERIADGDDQFSRAQLIRIAQRRRGQTRRREPQNREVTPEVARDDLGGKGSSIPKGDAQTSELGNMRIGDHDSVGFNNDTRAVTASPAADVNRGSSQPLGEFTESWREHF